MKCGVPFALAFGGQVAALSGLEKEAMSIHFSRFEGARFDFELMQFEEGGG